MVWQGQVHQNFVIWAVSWENQGFAYAKTKTQISFAVTAKLISTFVFATCIVQYLYFLNTKFQASSHLQWLNSLVCVRPGQNPHCWFFHVAAHFFYVPMQLFACLSKSMQWFWTMLIHGGQSRDFYWLICPSVRIELVSKPAIILWKLDEFSPDKVQIPNNSMRQTSMKGTIICVL